MIALAGLGAIVLGWFLLCWLAYHDDEPPARLPTQWETEKLMQQRLPPMRTLHADGTIEYVDVNHA